MFNAPLLGRMQKLHNRISAHLELESRLTGVGEQEVDGIRGHYRRGFGGDGAAGGTVP